MTEQPISKPLLVHRPTGRKAFMVCAENLLTSTPVFIDKTKYVLFIASEKVVLLSEVEEARRWIDAGVGYMCAWGPASSGLDDLFDYATFLPELGEPLSFTLMTTWHDDETLEDALRFAFYDASAPDDLEEELETIVVLVDSSAFAKRCETWVRENSE
jgi:hypothetical protein